MRGGHSNRRQRNSQNSNNPNLVPAPPPAYGDLFPEPEPGDTSNQHNSLPAAGVESSQQPLETATEFLRNSTATPLPSTDYPNSNGHTERYKK